MKRLLRVIQKLLSRIAELHLLVLFVLLLQRYGTIIAVYTTGLAIDRLVSVLGAEISIAEIRKKAVQIS